MDKYLALRLNDEDDDVVDLSAPAGSKIYEKLSLCLVGKLVSDKQINFDALIRTVAVAWNVKNNLVVRRQEHNLFFSNSFIGRIKIG